MLNVHKLHTYKKYMYKHANASYDQHIHRVSWIIHGM